MNQIIIITNGDVKTLRGVTKIRFQADNDGDKYVEVYQGKKKTRFNSNNIVGFKCKAADWYLR